MSNGILFSSLLVLVLTPVSLMDSAHAAKDRQKVIDFEDEIVEGMNKRPLDSVSQLSERDRRKNKPHLYRKRGGFRSETLETLREMRFQPSL